MKSSPRVIALLILATLILPLTASQISPDNERGGIDATGEWHKAVKAVKDATAKPS